MQGLPRLAGRRPRSRRSAQWHNPIWQLQATQPSLKNVKGATETITLVTQWQGSCDEASGDAERLTGILGVPLVSAPVSAGLLAAALLAGHWGWAGSWSRGGSVELIAARHSLRTISSSKLLMLPWLEKKSESSCKVTFSSGQASHRDTC